MAKYAEVGGNSNGGDDETVKKSPSRKLNGSTEYLTFLRSDANSAPFEKRWAHLIILTIIEALS